MLLSDVHPFVHTFAQQRKCKAGKVTASSSGTVRVRRLAQGHLDTRLGGAGNRTMNLPVTSQPALPPEPHAAVQSVQFQNCLPRKQTHNWHRHNKRPSAQ